jgi:hypothetical protein
MNLSSVALSILASSWAPDISTASASGLRRAQVSNDQGATVQEGSGDDECKMAKSKAAELTEGALSGCAELGANDQATVIPNPTCLLLFCRAQQMGNFLVTSSCKDETLVIFDSCSLVPGLLTPDPPQAFDDKVTLNFDETDSASVTVDVLANDKFTFGQTLQVTAIKAKRGSGSCKVVDDKVVYKPSFPDFDSGTTECDYETCYVGRYDTDTHIFPIAGVDLCDVATLEIDVKGAPTQVSAERMSWNALWCPMRN